MLHKNNYYRVTKTSYRKSVPKALKDRLWDVTYGPEAGQGKCYVCGSTINSKRFEAGHIISVFHGGGTILDNLKCICSTCNKSMGTQNLENFKRTYFPAIRHSLKNKCKCCCHNHVKKENIIDKINDKYDNLFIEEPNKNKQYIEENKILFSEDSDYSDYDSEEERKKERQRKILLMLDKYKYTPKK